MISFKKIIICSLLVFLICLMIADVVEGRGGARGGGFRGGGYRGSSRSYRSSRSSRSRSRVRNVIRTRSRSFNWNHAVAIGAVYGYSRYTGRSYYRRHSGDSNWRPQICVNYYDYKMDNGTAYTMFVCPQWGQSDDHVYCCGPEDRQKCCTWWGNGGHVALVVFLILGFLTTVGIVAFCCYRKHKKATPAQLKETTHFKTHPVSYTAAPQQVPPADVHPSYPQGDSQPYPVNPGYPEKTTPYPPDNASAPYPPEPMGETTPYPTQPYPTQPYSAQPYPPVGGDTSYPTTAPPPYPAQ